MAPWTIPSVNACQSESLPGLLADAERRQDDRDGEENDRDRVRETSPHPGRY